MQCNIDARGKAVRLISGMLTCAGAAALGALGWFEVIPWAVGLWAGLGTLAGGLFQIYEARAGWCVVRAMGFKTPI